MSSNRISIRSYTKNIRSHFHRYHQLVLPLHGSIEIKVGKFDGLVSLGDCVIIKSGQRHDFRANEQSKFIVIDTADLPNNIIDSPDEKVSIDAPLLSFMQFIEIQLNHHVNKPLESTVFDLFYQLLSQQPLLNKVDKRIEKIIYMISQDVSQNYLNADLADQACLSTTQFKHLFKAHMGVSCQKYITQLRMEKAKTLLTHTDTPIGIVAEQCGYLSPSAFCRKFKQYFAETPKAFVK